MSFLNEFRPRGWLLDLGLESVWSAWSWMKNAICGNSKDVAKLCLISVDEFLCSSIWAKHLDKKMQKTILKIPVVNQDWNVDYIKQTCCRFVWQESLLNVNGKSQIKEYFRIRPWHGGIDLIAGAKLTITPIKWTLLLRSPQRYAPWLWLFKPGSLFGAYVWGHKHCRKWLKPALPILTIPFSHFSSFFLIFHHFYLILKICSYVARNTKTTHYRIITIATQSSNFQQIHSFLTRSQRKQTDC